jgi:hypothetical protein
MLSAEGACISLLQEQMSIERQHTIQLDLFISGDSVFDEFKAVKLILVYNF